MALSPKALTTLANVKGYLRITSSYYDSYLEYLIEGVSIAVEKYTKRIWLGQYETAAHEYPDPRGKFLFLKARPIRDITTITEGTTVLPYTDDNNGAYRYERSKEEGMVERGGNLNLTSFDRDGYGAVGWMPGFRVIDVLYRGGYANQAGLPRDLVMAVDSVVSEVFKGAERVGGITNESVGSYSVSYGDIEKTMLEMGGVLGILDNYRDPSV